MGKSSASQLRPSADSDLNLLVWLATCVAVMSFLFYYRGGQILLYGDAVAHINIARRVFDSKTPGLLQLGTVWLPLPHLLMIPFLVSTEMWRRGVGGSIPSMAAYTFAVAGIFRFVRGLFTPADNSDTRSLLSARLAAWTAAIVFAANPNLIYLQTTAMGEAVYLAFFIWAVAYFAEALHDKDLRAKEKSLTKAGLCLFAACLTRYDGWFLAAVAGCAVIAGYFSLSPKPFGRATLAKFLLISAAGPLLWLGYNAAVYRNPLEFENGPYSAKAIEHRTQTAGNPGHPGSGNLPLATLYFVKACETNLSQNPWLGRAWILLGLLGVALAAASRRSDKPAPGPPAAGSFALWMPLALLLVPLPFYALSVAYGGVPIFVPAFWPLTHYNVRYGLQLLPAFSVAMGLLVYGIVRYARTPHRLRLPLAFGVIVFVVTSYASVWKAGPVCLKEAEINMRTRNQLELQLAEWFKRLPDDSTLLMYLGDHVGALEKAGVPLRRTINEGNHRVWMQPRDPDGLWERALENPAQFAEYAVAFEGDPVWQAVHDRGFKALVVIHVTGQSPAILYATRPPDLQ
jgi:hypothetical protein